MDHYWNSNFRIKLNAKRLKGGRRRLDVPAPKKRLGRRISSLERKWRKEVLTRDGMICRKCGLLGTPSMDVHHIAPRSRRPDLVTEVSNGASLHRLCHAWVHENPLEATEAGLLSTETYEKARKGRLNE